MIQIYVVSNHAYTTNSETKNVPSPLLFFHWLLQPHRCTLISIPWKEWSMLDLCGHWNHSVFSRMLSFLRGLAAVGNFFFLRYVFAHFFSFFLSIICFYGASCLRCGYGRIVHIEMSILTYLHLSWSRMTWLMEEEILLIAHVAHVITCFLMLDWQTSPSSRKQTFTIQSCTFGPACSRYYKYKISLACFIYVSHLTIVFLFLFLFFNAQSVLVDWALKKKKIKK